MGSLGPVRVITQSPEATGPAPFEWIQNPQSLIDKSDLVFIDAPMTGFSRAVGKGTAKDFAGTDQDIQAFLKFIVRYITVNQSGTRLSSCLASRMERHVLPDW